MGFFRKTPGSTSNNRKRGQLKGRLNTKRTPLPTTPVRTNLNWPPNKKLSSKDNGMNEEISSDSSGDEAEVERVPSNNSRRVVVIDEDVPAEEGEAEQAQEKLEKEFLQKVDEAEKSGDASSDDEEEEEEELVAAAPTRAQEPPEQKYIADQVKFASKEAMLVYRPHRFSPVCVSISSDGRYVVSCSKDGSVVKYDYTARKVSGSLRNTKNEPNDDHHKGEVMCCAISPDDKYLATGGVDGTLRIWDFSTLAHLKTFKAHRKAVTALTFRKTNSPIELFTGSADRSVKAWNLDQMGFVDTMYGHLDSVQQMSMLIRGRVLTCGGQDRSLRLFKVAEESQLVFNGLNDCFSIDCVAMINEEHFVSGSADGSIYIWSLAKKKPVCVVRRAHAPQDPTTTMTTQEKAYWISAVAACPYTDLVASGSWDGKMKLWRVAKNYKALDLVQQFELVGFINDIRFTDDAKLMACAVGQEHRRGRWWKVPEAKNTIALIPLEHVEPEERVSAGSKRPFASGGEEDSDDGEEEQPRKAKRKKQPQREESSDEEDD